jgi:hypothetical protein
MENMENANSTKRRIENIKKPVDYNSNLCPMPPCGVDLCGVKLSKDQRLWLAMAVASGLYKAKELALRWNIKYNSLKEYGNRLKNGKFPSDSIGRPKLLDDQAFQQVKVAIIDLGIRDKDILKSLCDQAYTLSYKRKRIEVENDSNYDYLEMNYRSKYRYLHAACNGTQTRLF